MNKLIAVAVVGLALFGAVYPVTALPLASNGFATKQSAPEITTNVYCRGGGRCGGYWQGRGWGWRAGYLPLPIGAGAAFPYYSYGQGYYDNGPYYLVPAYNGVVYVGPPNGEAVSYCMQTFRSYNPRTGTYLGYDGLRHPCP